MLDHAWIAAHVPHQGSMCLLEAVTEWSGEAIVCRALSHRYPDNPLRAEGRLGAAAGIEYAAQAMAVHGALLAGDGDRPSQGYLASVRGVSLHASRLDDLPDDLVIAAECLSGDAGTALYRFDVSHRGRCLVAGKAVVVLDAAALSTPRR